jgi:polyhydroxyalkanoate synthase subunit PhaC
MTKLPVKVPQNPPPPEARPPDPKPLALHMSLQALISLSALSALPLWSNGSLNLKSRNGKNLPANALLPAKIDAEAFSAAVTHEAITRLSSFSDGIRNYQDHPRQPRPVEPPAIWALGATRVLDYGVYSPVKNAPPVLIVPSLINRAYILDLAEDRSLVRHLARCGFRPLLVDWGWPGETEKAFGLDNYIADRLQAALDFCCSLGPARPALIGYCMGGNLALALANRNPGGLSALALLATPWDFHSDGGANARLIEMMAPMLDKLISQIGVLPVDMLQAMFAGLDPAQTGVKFRHFSGSPKNQDAAKRFVMLEDWVNDGVPLSGKVARECLFGWYGDNAPFKGTWEIRGDVVDPGKVVLPTFTAIPSKDHIVPPASARALAEALPNTTVLTPSAGHIGMVAGSRSAQKLYIPLTEWLTKQLLSC